MASIKILKYCLKYFRKKNIFSYARVYKSDKNNNFTSYEFFSNIKNERRLKCLKKKLCN